MKKIRCVVITNVPVPYRVPVWERLADFAQVELHVVYCAPAQIDPTQSGHSLKYGVHFLRGAYKDREAGFTHGDFSVVKLLARLKPDVVVTTGFIPTYLYAFAWSIARGIPHVAMTDGTRDSEGHLTFAHRLVRKLVFSLSKSFVGACGGSRDLFRDYGVPPEKIHLSPLCDDNALFGSGVANGQYDFLFCGQLVERKNPLFAVRVADGVAKRLGRTVSIRFMGKGPMEDKIRQEALSTEGRVDLSFAGYLLQKAMPAEYAASRVFLFPTQMDCWGVVINEACAAGLPCVISPYTGVANELVVNGENGYVCPIELATWVDRCTQLLSDEVLWQDFSSSAKEKVKAYTFESAAKGVLDAAVQATST